MPFAFLGYEPWYIFLMFAVLAFGLRGIYKWFDSNGTIKSTVHEGVRRSIGSWFKM